MPFREQHALPVIADEIYGNMVFEGATFHPMASLTSSVPILHVGGIAKEFLVPGWRVGWVCVHDRQRRLEGVRRGLFALSQVRGSLGPGVFRHESRSTHTPHFITADSGCE